MRLFQLIIFPGLKRVRTLKWMLPSWIDICYCLHNGLPSLLIFVCGFRYRSEFVICGLLCKSLLLFHLWFHEIQFPLFYLLCGVSELAKQCLISTSGVSEVMNIEGSFSILCYIYCCVFNILKGHVTVYDF